MPRFCVILHEPSAEASVAWTRIGAAQAAGNSVIVLFTGLASGSPYEALASRVRGIGAELRLIEEFHSGTGLMVFPAVIAHRLGVKVADALAALAADELWFVGSPAAAAASLADRRCGRTGLSGRKMILEVFEIAEVTRSQAGVFPTGGREAMGTDFLERTAVAMADEIVCSDPAVESWVSLARSRPSGGAGLPAGQVPAISVCIPFYEKQEYLEAALASLAAQSVPPHEVIVIDDGSPSAAAAAAWQRAASQYAGRGWKFIRQANAGPAAARNRAALEATGEALLFCDADNRFRPTMIATFGRAMEASGADLITCAFVAFSSGEEGAPETPRHIFAPLGPSLDLGLLENVLGDTNSLFRRRPFLDAGGFVSGLLNEDWRLMLEWVQSGRSYATTSEVLFEYRLGKTSRSLTESEFASASAVVAPLIQWEPAMTRLWPHLAGLVRDSQAARLSEELERQKPVLARLTEEAPRLAAEVQRLTGELVQVHQGWHESQMLAAERAKLLTVAQGRLAESESALSQAGQDAARARLRDRVNRAHIFLLERLSDEHQAAAAASKATAAELRHQVAALTTRGAADRALAETTIGGLRGRIERMQQSFSWRSTAWLRALRRRFIDRPAVEQSTAPSVPAPGSLAVLHHLDAPRLWTASEPAVTIRGWAFPQSQGEFDAVRARIGSRVYPGLCGLERPDLAAIFPQWPGAAFSGFKIEVDLLADDAQVALDGRDESGGWHLIVAKALTGADHASTHGSYAHWLQHHPYPAADDLQRLRAAAEAGAAPIKFSVLMPVYNPPDKWLCRAIESVRSQTYPNWELCIADDASTQPHVRRTLERFASEEPRIKLIIRPQNGHISAATNSALELATGEFTALFDHDDELAPHALHCVAEELRAHPAADLVYSDEDKIDEQGARFDPHFKPDWNPELLRAQNYLSHLTVYRTAVLREAGGLRPGFEGSQDWDLALRVTERVAADHIRHIPRVLYHWRASEGSTALHLGEKKYVTDSARRALTEHFDRLGEAVTLERIIGGHWHVAYALPSPRPLVSIIIPTRNAGNLVRLCLASIFARTNYAPFEILLVDNRSDDPESLAIFAAAERDDGVRVLKFDAPFNYSAINNFAAAQAKGEILCLLNNDIEVLESHWLDELAAHAVRPATGAVGARLYYPDLRVQHAGVITGLGGVAGHGFKYFERTDPGTPQFRPHVAQNLTAVTAACLVIRKSTYWQAGGFDESELTVAFNDVDFCLKVAALGYRNVYAPFAELIHHESASRGKEDTPEKILRFQAEIAAIKGRWGERLLWDPAYNPNLSLDSEDFALAYPPRVPPL
jgi:glycosyltransferase involved in cell wall biosynthesis